MKTPKSSEIQQLNISPGDLGADDDKAIGRLIADTKLKATQQAFDSRYEKGITSWIEKQGPTQEDIEKGQLLASIAIEARRKALIDTTVRSGGFFGALMAAALIINIPPHMAIAFCSPASVIAGILTEQK